MKRLFTGSAPPALRRAALLAGAGLLGLSAMAAPAIAEPAAVVENVSAKSVGVKSLQLLDAGKVLDLGADQTAVLGYLKSCQRETITGGKVTIGSEQSTVAGGKVERAKVPCDAKALAGSPSGEITLYGASPAVVIDGGRSKIEFERLDKKSGRIMFGRSSKADLADKRIAFEPGSTYRVRAANREVTVKIDPSAKPGETPLVSRMIRF